MSNSPRAAVAQRRDPLLLVRLRAGLPRRVFVCAMAVLSLLGLRTLVAGTPQSVGPERTGASEHQLVPVAVTGFTEAFARAYLSFDTTDPGRRAVALAAFGAGELDAHAGVALPDTGRREVVWTAAVAYAPTGRRRATVTVAAQLAAEERLRFLTVPVASSERGLAVADFPALVGAPRLDRGAQSLDGEDVEDRALERVVVRAAGNYVRGAAGNLAADLAPGARVPSSPQELELVDVVRVASAGQGRVAATVLARDRAGVVFTLRYELSVVRQGRWFVRSIGPSNNNTRR